jgi:hypothetical protein
MFSISGVGGLNILKIGILPDAETTACWPHIRSLLQPAADLGNVPLLDDHELVWLVTEDRCIVAAATTRLTDDGAEIVLCGGRGLYWAKPLAAKICAWAKDEGASRVRIGGRRGWARVLGWPERDGITEKAL